MEKQISIEMEAVSQRSPVGECGNVSTYRIGDDRWGTWTMYLYISTIVFFKFYQTYDPV